MIRALISDFSKVLLFPKDENYSGSLNGLNKELLKENPNYKIFDYFDLNEELLSFYRELKNKGVKLYVFTTDRIQENLDIKLKIDDVFEKIFIGGEMGVKKSTPDGYKIIIEEIGVLPKEGIYLDDVQENIDTSISMGLNSILFLSNSQSINHISRLLIN